MLLFAEGFDDFATIQDYGLTASFVQLNYPTAPDAPIPGRGGFGKAGSFNPGSPFGYGDVVIWGFAPTLTVIAGFAITMNGCELTFMAGTTRLFSLKQTSAAGLSFYDSTNPGGKPTPGLLGSATFRNWSSYVEVSLTLGTSSTPGSVIVRVDGLVVFTGAGNFGTGPCDSLAIGAVTPAVCQIDDIYVCDTSGATCNTFLGDTRVTSVAPIADGSESQWLPSAGFNHFSLVDETPIDGDTSYVSATASGLSDTYEFPSTAVAAGSVIAAIQVRAYAKTASGGADTLQAVARISGVDYLQPVAPGTAIHAVYTGIDSVFPVNPATNMAWTVADLASTEFGVKNIAAGAVGGLTPQEITFPAIPDHLINDPPFALLATSSSGLPVSYFIGFGGATVAGDMLTLTGVVASISVTAYQVGNGTFAPAAQVVQVFVARFPPDSGTTPQTVTFPQIPTHFTTDAPFTPDATSTSGLPVFFAVIAGPATAIDSHVVTLTGVPGTVTISAFAYGNSTYAGSNQVMQDFIVS